MSDRLASRCILIAFIAHGALALTGCGKGPETEYGLSEGKSLNGTSVLRTTLEREEHEVEAAIRLNDELAEWADGIIRFAPYPGAPDREEAEWYASWLASDSDRWLIYVVGDFDSSADYWKSMVLERARSNEPEGEEEAKCALGEAVDRAGRLAARSAHPADATTWFEVDTAWEPPRTCTSLSGPWAADLDAAEVTLSLHEPLKANGATVLLAGDGKPFVIEKAVRAQNRLLVVANGSFLLNETLVKAARTRLLASVLDWIGQDRCRIALVEGSFVLEEAQQPLSVWQLLQRLASFRWIAIQIGIAAIFAALARAPRLGRPRDVPRARADRPAAHAEALGALLARSGSPQRAREIIDHYRLWRHRRALPEPAVARDRVGSRAERYVNAGTGNLDRAAADDEGSAGMVRFTSRAD
jgi:hypothetical protein